METKCACGGPWSAEWELLSSDFKTCSYAVQRWFRNFNTAKAKATKTNLQEKKKTTTKNMVENKIYAKALPAKIVSPYQGKGKITFFFSFLV